MSDALPALVPGLINSVIAPRGKPRMGSSRKGKPVIKRVAVMCEGRGKRSASRLRRSIILALAAMGAKHGASEEYVQENIYRWPSAFASMFFPALLLADQCHHHALDLKLGSRYQIWIARVFRL